MIAVIAISVVACVNAVALILVLRQQCIDRKDMLDRLMSRSFEEYKELTDPLPPVSDPVDISDEEEWKREIEAMKQER